MQLAHEVAGAANASSTVVFLHGILGAKNNWRSFAKRFTTALPQWRAIACDLRNHGESHGFPPPHTIAACADDVERTVTLSAQTLVVGHSYGGKVALELHARHARDTWVLDCPPGPRAFTHEDTSEIARVLAAIRAVAMPVASRAALVEALRAQGLSEALQKWMTTNLRPLDAGGGDGFVWRFDLAAIPEMLASFGASDFWDVVEDARMGGDPSRARDANGRLVMVRGGRSDRFKIDDVARLQRAVARGTVVERVLENAGHWVHTDDPEGLLALFVAEYARAQS